jgi:hypothetical protein
VEGLHRNLYIRAATLLALALVTTSAAARAAASAVPKEPALPGYAPVPELLQRVKALSGRGGAKVDTLGATLSGAPVLAVEFHATAAGLHPGLAIVGGLGPGQHCGAEVVTRLAERLAAGGDEAQALLSRMNVYLIPLPCPDAIAAGERAPYSAATVNADPADDDRDGKLDEDGPGDLDGDGWITQIRVKDPAGKYRAHPLDPRVLIPVKPDQNEAGAYSVYTEGIDNDQDGQYNEDGPGGTDFDKNWTWNYQLYAPGTGFNPVSEPETRALADFLYDHADISMVYTLGPQDNLAHPWQPGNDGGRIKTGVLADDAPVLKQLSEQYKQQFDTAVAPGGAAGDGSFPYWAYFHYGRWSLAALPWWVPEVKDAAPGSGDTPVAGQPTGQGASATGTGGTGAAAPPSAATLKPAWDEHDERGKEELRWLKWLDVSHIDGFAPWTPVADPDFPGAQVEAGGFRLLRVMNPPAAELDGLAGKQLQFVAGLAQLQPQLAIDRVKVEDRGGGVYHVELRVVNSGYLPTVSAMGDLSGQDYPLQATLTLPPGATLPSHRQRQFVPRLDGQGGSATLEWLVQAPQGGMLHLRVASPSVGEAQADIQLAGGAA